jgi:pre-mRNA-splicing factor CWC22
MLSQTLCRYCNILTQCIRDMCWMQILVMLLENPTDDSVEIAIAFVKAVGAALDDAARAAFHEVFVRFRAILQEGRVSKKTQYQVEGLMAVRKAGFESQGLMAVKPELDLVEADDQLEHDVRPLRVCCDFGSPHVLFHSLRWC